MPGYTADKQLEMLPEVHLFNDQYIVRPPLVRTPAFPGIATRNGATHLPARALLPLLDQLEQGNRLIGAFLSPVHQPVGGAG